MSGNGAAMKFDYSKTLNEQLPTFEYYKDRYCSYELGILELQQENAELKKQFEKYKKKLMIATKMEMKEIDKNTFVGIDYFQDKCIIYENQQKEFTEWLENGIETVKNTEFLDERIQIAGLVAYNRALQKYKSIIGGKKDES